MIVDGRFNHYDLHLIGAVYVNDLPDNRTEIVPDTVNLATLSDSATMTALRVAATDSENTNYLQTEKFMKLLFEVMFDNENRLRTLAGQPTITRTQYRNGLLTVWRNL